MFQDPLVVKIEGTLVTLSIRTSDERVDEFEMTIDSFEQLVKEAKVHGKQMHFPVRVSPSYTTYFAVGTSSFQVMVAQLESVKGGV